MKLKNMLILVWNSFYSQNYIVRYILNYKTYELNKKIHMVNTLHINKNFFTSKGKL